MIDIFRFFHISQIEKSYKECLQAMLKHGSPDFKKRVGEQFNIEGDYQIDKGVFGIYGGIYETGSLFSTDLILYNSVQISVILPRGFYPSKPEPRSYYTLAAEVIKKWRGGENANVSFYCLALPGNTTENTCYKTVKWTDFYEAVLRESHFKDAALEVIRQTILYQVEMYRLYESTLELRSYRELFDDEVYLATPLAIFSSGAYVDAWHSIAGEEQYDVWNGTITLQNHEEYRTFLTKKNWKKYGVGNYDNIHLYISIAWHEDPIVWLCWHYFTKDYDNHLLPKYLKPQALQNKAIESLRRYKENWKPNIICLQTGIQTTYKRADSIRALKCIVNGEQEIADVIKDIQSVVLYYTEEINKIINAFIIKDDYLEFSIETYNKHFQKDD